MYASSIAAVVLSLALGPATPAPGQTTAGEMQCVRAWGESRYSAGYDHLVYIANGCELPISCAVWTDVNPERQTVAIEPRQEVYVLTFRGSPAFAFTPFVNCRRDARE